MNAESFSKTGEVLLEEWEIYLIGQVAIQRYAQNLCNGYVERWGAGKSSLDRHYIGAFGEYVVAKYLGRFWNGALGNLRAKDVGSLQVRASDLEDPCLLLHPSDPDDDVFILVSVLGNAAKIHGWIRGRDGKRDEYWRTDTGRPAWFVPRYLMRPPKPPI